MPANIVRIAKNTLMLYFRQILLMLVSLYTVRVKLEILGVEDFGIYSVVYGIVAMFTFLNIAMTGATKRFLAFALGQNNTEQAKNVYSASIVIHGLIAVFVVILAQAVGLWFLYNVLNIPPERQAAAFVVYQFSVVAAVISIFQVPYRATIIAYEKMSFFAMLGIVEAVLKLGIVLLLPVILFDHLMVYAFLVCITAIIILLAHKIYCNRKFEIARFRYCKDKELFQQLFRFSGWSVLGGVANAGKNHGTNILVNIFHGLTVNAAMGIAAQVNLAVSQFVNAFQKAFGPQIIKSYSAQDYDYLMQLIFRTSKASFYLLLFFALPLYINANFVLQIWLGNVPEYLIAFTRLSLLYSLVHAISVPLWTSIQATGDIKKFQIVGSCFRFSNLPLALLFLWIGFSPVWIFIIRVCIEVIILGWSVFFIGKMVKLRVLVFFYNAIAPISIVAGVSAFATSFSYNLFEGNWSRLIMSCIISTISIACLIYWIGLNRQERSLLNGWLKRKLKRGNGI